METTTQQYEVDILYGNPENLIRIHPPITTARMDSLVEAGHISSATAERSALIDAPSDTYIPFGKLILGAKAMDKATLSLAHDIRVALNQ